MHRTVPTVLGLALAAVLLAAGPAGALPSPVGNAPAMFPPDPAQIPQLVVDMMRGIFEGTSAFLTVIFDVVASFVVA